MNNDFYKKIIEEFPIGYAYHKIICDQEGLPIDYEYIEVNPAFAELTGLNISDINGKRLSEIFSGSDDNEFDWIKFYGRVAIDRDVVEFDMFSERLNRWFRIYAYSPEKYYFITIFMNITKEMRGLEENKTILTALTDIVLELDKNQRVRNIIVTDDNILFLPKKDIIGRNIKDIFPEEIKEPLSTALKDAFDYGDKRSFICNSIVPEDDRWFNIDVSYLTGENNKRYIVSISNVTDRKMLQDELLKKTVELESFFDINLDLLCIADLEGNFIKVNKEWESVLGYSKEVLEKMKFLDFIHPEDLDSTIESIDKLAKNKKIFNFVNRYRCIDGSYRFVEWRSHPAGGLIYAAARDITESKQAEANIIKLSQEYETVFNSTQDSMFLVEVLETDSFRYIRNNKSHQESTGLILNGKTPQELLGKSMGALIASNYSRCVREAVPIVYEEDLTIKGVNRIWSTSLTPVFDVDRVVYIVGSSQDITARKIAEEALKRSHERIANILEGTNVGTWEWNVQTGEALFNERWAEIIGYSLDELRPVSIETWLKFVHPDDLEASQEQLSRVFSKTKEYYDIECRMLHKNGSIVWVNDRGKVVSWTEDGKPLLMSGTHIDITQRKSMESWIFSEKERLKTTLLSIGDGVISVDRQGNIVLINEVAEQLTGWSQEDAFGRPLEEVFNIVNELSRKKCDNPVKQVMERGEIIELANHTILISKDGIERPIEDSAAPIKDECGHISGVVLVFRDFTEKKERQEKIEFLSFHDQLTGLYNRRFFEEELKRLDTVRNLPISLILIDVNGLKLVNDAFGHKFGDELLVRVSQLIAKECREDEIIARIGGDEFILLLSKTDFSQAKEIGKRINDQINIEKIGSVNLSISYGCGTKSTDFEDVSDVFKRAEDKMYQHKLSEKSSIRYETIKVIIKSLYEKNAREQRHSIRVSQICSDIGRAMGLDQDHVSELSTAGLLHDIGKIAIEDKILNKLGSLKECEWKEVKRHPQVGYSILSSLNEYAPLAEYVLAHHERLDGSGYPKGLKREDIPWEARIITIADAYDAMTGEKTYGKSLSVDEAIGELKRNAGTQFDEEIAKIFVEKVLEQSW
ncbi:MAG: PAS domain S-box protein [Peptococcaceae bacterium]|nr:PAS domain S-box protein [Peptococcaceae bacterium]